MLVLIMIGVLYAPQKIAAHLQQFNELEQGIIPIAKASLNCC